MQAYVVSHEDWNLFLGRVMEDRAVVGPRQRPDQPGFYYFDHVKDPRDLALDYTTTTIPPKNAFFPPIETLFRFTESNPPEINLVRDTTPFLIVGVHPCDLAAIDALDSAYSYPPAEVRWVEQRKRATIVGIDCLPDEYCFCASMGTSESRKTCDLFLTLIDGAYFIEVHTAAGEKMLKTVPKIPTQARHLEEVERWHSEKVALTTASLDSPIAEFADILDRGGLTPVWQEVASRCYSCGSCNTTCPTCFCFSMDDEFDLTLATGCTKTFVGFLSTAGVCSCCRRTQLSWRTLATGEAPLAQEVPIPVQEVGASLLHRLRSLQPGVHCRYQYRGRFPISS